MPRRVLQGDKAVDRLLNFSDAVVAVAVTVLALPLVDIAGPAEGQTVLAVLSSHLNQIVTFVATFLVVTMMWSIHNRVMNTLSAYDSVVFWLNAAWLIGFVLLPWPAAMHGAGSDWSYFESVPFDSSGTGVFYWLTLAYISGTGALMGWYLGRHPALLSPEGAEVMASISGSRARYRGLLFTLLFVLAAITSFIFDWLGFYALILMWPLGRWLRGGPQPVHQGATADPEVRHDDH